MQDLAAALDEMREQLGAASSSVHLAPSAVPDLLGDVDLLAQANLAASSAASTAHTDASHQDITDKHTDPRHQDITDDMGNKIGELRPFNKEPPWKTWKCYCWNHHLITKASCSAMLSETKQVHHIYIHAHTHTLPCAHNGSFP